MSLGGNVSATRVLIVDDDAPVLKSTSRIFRAIGCEVFLAAGGREALEVVRTQTPLDLVVSDLEMPGMRGTDLVREIGRISPATVHVLMTGAQVDPKAVPEGVPLVRKPFSIEELLGAARAAVDA